MLDLFFKKRKSNPIVCLFLDSLEPEPAGCIWCWMLSHKLLDSVNVGPRSHTSYMLHHRSFSWPSPYILVTFLPSGIGFHVCCLGYVAKNTFYIKAHTVYEHWRWQMEKKMLKSLFLNPDVCIVLLLLWLFCVDGRVHNLPAVFSSVLKTSVSLERSIHVLIIM